MRIIVPTVAVRPSDPCPLVIDGMLVYRNEHHLTATFARSLASWLRGELADAHDGREGTAEDGVRRAPAAHSGGALAARGCQSQPSRTLVAASAAILASHLFDGLRGLRYSSTPLRSASPGAGLPPSGAAGSRTHG